MHSALLAAKRFYLISHHVHALELQLYSCFLGEMMFEDHFLLILPEHRWVDENGTYRSAFLAV